MPSSSTTRSNAGPPDDAAARERLAHRVRSGAIAIEGPDREAFLQGQLTQDVRGLAPGAARLAAGLTPRGKLLYFGMLTAEPERLLLLFPEDAVAGAAAHLAKYAAFQKTRVRDATADYLRVALYGPQVRGVRLPEGARILEAGWDLAGEILAPADLGPEVLRALVAAGSTAVGPGTALALRIEAGRPRLGTDADASHLPDEVGLSGAISAAKGCYVGQEIVARMRTYGRANRRLGGFRFPETPLPAGTVFSDPEKPSLELARITSVADSPRYGAIGLGLVFRDVADGARLVLPEAPDRTAVVTSLPFA